MTHAQPLVVGLVDDAGLFPPTALSMRDVLARHREDDALDSPVLTDRLLVPVSRVRELLDLLPQSGIDTLMVGLVVDRPLAELADAVTALDADPRTTLTGIETRLRPLGAESATLPDAVAAIRDAVAGLPARVSVVVEVPLGDDLPEVLATLADAGLGAKARCGGAEQRLFPAPDALAAFVEGAVRAGLPFKLTAGLHHAMPYHDDATDLDHHGYLGLLVATLRAVTGAPRADVAAAVTSDDAAALTSEVLAAGDGVQQQAREHFVAYGSCDTRAPLADLRDLGLA